MSKSIYQEAMEIMDRFKKYGFNEINIRKLREENERYMRQKAYEAGFQRSIEIMQMLEEENFDGTHIEPRIFVFEEFQKWEEENGTNRS